MARRDKIDAATADSPGPAMSRKVRRQLAKRLATMKRRLAKAEAMVAKRSAQLEAASARRSELVERLAALSGAVSEPRETGTPEVVLAYCIRERTRVTMRDPRPVVLTNGRNALAGTCTSCGAKVMRLVGA